MSQTLIALALSQRTRRAGRRVVRLNHVQLYRSSVVSVKVETSFPHVGNHIQ